MNKFEVKFDNIYEHIRKAKEEAMKKNIEVNTIMIDKEIAYTNHLIGVDGNVRYDFPPMLFGMKVLYKENLPNNANFILTKTPKNKMEQINELEEKLGIDLPILFKAKKIYYKYFEEDTEIKESYKVYFDITDNLLHIKEYEEDEYGYKFSLKEYKKYWSLRKEDLENEKED